MFHVATAYKRKIWNRTGSLLSCGLVFFWGSFALGASSAPKRTWPFFTHLETIRWATSQPAESNGSAAQRSQPHLAEWLRLHSNMTLQQQEKALRDEPGFSRLPVSRQQRLMERLRQLNSMPPQQRERVLDRMEALEKLSPEQRQQLRVVMQQVSQLPEKQRQTIREALRNLRQLPPPQQEMTINSARYRKEFSDSERRILDALIRIQPNAPSQAAVANGGK